MSKALPIIDPNAGGIDVGSEQFHVSIAGKVPQIFGTFTSEVHRLRDHLLAQKCNTVAMEATGVYWIYLYTVLEEAGIKVIVVNGRHVRNLPGRKTDIADCQWLATLHSHGLLGGGFVPPAGIRKLQDYQRLRSDHIVGASSQIQKMQQALERMNIKFHDVISDLNGYSGMKVVEAIIAGERSPEALLELCDLQIKKKKSKQVIESLRGTWAPEHLFALHQAHSAWTFYNGLIKECDSRIETVLKELAGETPDNEENENLDDDDQKKIKKSGKNAPHIADFHKLILRVCGGKDLTAIPGVADYLGMQLISETGVDMSHWKTEKHFTAWCGVSPGSRQSGKRRGSVKRQRNRAGRLFCTAARSLVRSVDKGLGGFYRRLAYRKGGLVAMQAVARKLAILYYRTLRFGFAYAEKGLKAYEEKYSESQRRLLAKLANQHGFKLVSTMAEKLQQKPDNTTA